MSNWSISISREDAQRIFDLAVGADQACSGYMETDDVSAVRRLAEALGIDPATCTGEEFVTQFPHAYKPGRPEIGEYRRTIVLHRSDTRHARSVEVTRPETDDEVLARLGAAIPEQCVAGRWNGRCGKAADDPIHAAARETAEMGA